MTQFDKIMLNTMIRDLEQSVLDLAGFRGHEFFGKMKVTLADKPDDPVEITVVGVLDCNIHLGNPTLSCCIIDLAIGNVTYHDFRIRCDITGKEPTETTLLLSGYKHLSAEEADAHFELSRQVAALPESATYRTKIEAITLITKIEFLD